MRWTLALVSSRLQPSGDPDPAGLWHGVGWLCLILQACKVNLLWLPDCVLLEFLRSKTLLLCNDFVLECKGLLPTFVTHSWRVLWGYPPVLAARNVLLSLQAEFLKI